MISLHLEPDGRDIASSRLLAPLCTAHHVPVDRIDGGDFFAASVGLRHSVDRQTASQFFRAADGTSSLFDGSLHNRVELVERLGLGAAASDAQCYAHCVSRWGDDADEIAVGHYCSITVLPDRGGLRLARSPFVAPPLHFRATDEWVTASSVIRGLFWREGVKPRPDYIRLVRALTMHGEDQLRGWFEGCGRVPLGTVVRIDGSRTRVSWRYDLLSRPKVRLASDEDYVEAALALLDEATAKELEGANAPGVFISGGLDSAQVAASALEALPGNGLLHSFTYDPDPDAPVNPGWYQYVGERGAVERFAAMHPRLKPHFFNNTGQDFRHGQRDLLRLMDCAPPSMALAWHLHDLFEKARETGCDRILGGDFGNMTFSSAAPWLYSEYLLKGRWGELTKALRADRQKHRSMLFRFLKLSVFPLLPNPIQDGIDRVARRNGLDWFRRIGVSRDWGKANNIEEPEYRAWATRRQYWQTVLDRDGQDVAELRQGLEQLYGVSWRDPTSYRPLVEFCFGLPTDQFFRDGTDRWLARRMARGRLPEEQRQETRYGMHEADWHARTAPIVDELMDEIDRMADDVDIAAILDLPALRQTLRDFPDELPAERSAALPYTIRIPTAVTAGRYIAMMKGRNDI